MANFSGRLRAGDGGQARAEFAALQEALDRGTPMIEFTDRETFGYVRNRVSGFISSQKMPYRLRTSGDPLALWLEPKTIRPARLGVVTMTEG